MRKTSMRAIGAVLVLAGTIMMTAQSAAASPKVGTDAPPVGFGIRFEGRVVPFEELSTWTLDVGKTTPEPTGTITPRLIDWDQYFGCFSLNHSEDLFAEFTHWWNGENHDYQLRCGDGGPGGWGYKHIREEHEDDWQEKFNVGLAVGWVPESQGIESWDDLMANSAGNAGQWPDHMRAVDPLGGTTCLVATGVFYDAFSGAELSSFNYRTVFSNTTERLITAFPQNETYCPKK